MTPMASGMLGATTSPGGSVYSAQHPGRSHNSSTLLADSQQPNAAPADLFAMRRCAAAPFRPPNSLQWAAQCMHPTCEQCCRGDSIARRRARAIESPECDLNEARSFNALGFPSYHAIVRPALSAVTPISIKSENATGIYATSVTGRTRRVSVRTGPI